VDINDVPREFMQANAGKDVIITYADDECSVAGATELWLLWVPE